MKNAFFISLFFIFLSPAALFAQPATEDEPLQEQENLPEQIIEFVESALEFDDPLHIGQTVTYRATIEHSPELTVHFTYPDQSSRWRELSRKIDRIESEELHRTTAELRYTLLRPGPTQGPPIQAQIEDIKRGTLEPFELPQHPLTVNPLAEEGAELGAPRAPRQIWTERSLTLIYAAGAGSLLLIALLSFIALRRRTNLLDESPALSPHEAALQALSELQHSSLLEDGEFKEFYLRLSEILRRYLGQRFHFPGVEWTTTEIMNHLGTLDAADFEADLDALGQWLRFADRVKFAGLIPTEEAATNSLTEAIGFVEITIPKPVSPEIDDEGEEESREEQR